MAGAMMMMMSMSAMSISGVMFICCIAVALYIYKKSKTTNPVTNTEGGGVSAPSCVEAKQGNRPVFGYEYRVRENKAGKWACPSGWSDTGCNWAQGYDAGKLQCRRPAQVSPGKWESPYYGRKAGNDLKFSCRPGKHISGVVLFGGEDENAQTNAIGAYCSAPDGSDPSNALSNGKPTCGNRDYPHTGRVFADILNVGQSTLTFGLMGDGSSLSSMIADTTKAGFGRKLWANYPLATPTGITGWKVHDGKDGTCPKSGLCGLNLFSAEGAETGWAGGQGTKLKNATTHDNNIQSGSCPPGKIVKEIRTTCGDRVDGIQFICDVPDAL